MSVRPADYRARLTEAQPSIVAFVEDRLAEHRARAVAFELISGLLAAHARWAPPVAPLGIVQLTGAERELARDDDPVHGWKSSLPIALPSAQRRQVSAVMSAIVHALDAAAAGPEEHQRSRAPRPRTLSGRRVAV